MLEFEKGIKAMDLINPAVVSGADQYRRAFAEAKPFRYVVIGDFFNGDFCQALMRDFPPFDEDAARNELGQVGGKAVRTDVLNLGTTFIKLDNCVRSADFLSLIEQITGIPELLHDPEYEGGGTHENLSGQELDSHVDFNYHPRTGWHRRLNLIVYLNEVWVESWGGAIELHTDPWDPKQDERVKILPTANP